MFFCDAVFIPDDQGELVAVATTVADAVAPLPPVEMGTALVKMLLTLLALIALLFATFWFLRKLIRNRMQRGVGKQSIEILEKRMISPKTMLYIVKIENKKILFAESHLEIKALDTSPIEKSPSDEDS